MIIEQGKFYRTRGGDKVEVIKTGCKNGMCICYIESTNSVMVVGMNGHLYDDKSESLSDLVSEWTDPVEIPWEDYPAWAKWIAMEFLGDWYAWTSKPSCIGKKEWVGNSSNIVRIPIEYIPKNFTGDWTESLFERP